MSEIVLECDNVVKIFRKDGAEVPVLRGINLEIKHGEAVAILGASGTGKSTLLHVLGTLEPPTSGQVLYHGENVHNYSANKLAEFRNRELGFVFQFHYLLQEFTALENVLMPALIAGESKEKFIERAIMLLKAVGLEHRMQHRPGELSGGEQQRVAIARAMIMSPKILLADEPTGNLDSANAQNIKSLLLEMNANHGVTLALVTHDRDLASTFARQIIMRDGQIALH
jgi:lipoprotein-releasing system ATP-binding protein